MYFADTEASKAQPPVFAGAIDHVADSVDEDGRGVLHISVKKGEDRQLVAQPTALLNTAKMSPISDSKWWGYLPAWYFSCEWASKMLSRCIVGTPPSGDYISVEACVEKLKTLRPYASMLETQYVSGKMGRYTLHNYISPKTDSGMDVYAQVVESCRVRPLLALLLGVFMTSLVRNTRP